MNIKQTALILPLSFTLAYSALILWNDVDAFYGNVNSDNCCGWVDPNPIKRPFTYLMIDEWTTGNWQLNGDKSEEWFVKDGLVNGKVEFWTITDTRSPALTTTEN